MNNSALGRIAILGAGPSGLGAAHRLQEMGYSNFHVHESTRRAGGLAASFVDRCGFTWDIGGHIQFSHYQYFDKLMSAALGNRWYHHKRESWIWIEDRFVPYPLQNNIRHLKRETQLKCLLGLVQLYKQPPLQKPRHFGDWIDATFGKGIGESFMLPYNYKVWAYPPEMMGYSWVGERVAVTDLSRMLDNIFREKDDVSWGPNATFQFPQRGGTGAVWEAVAGKIGAEHFTFDAQAVRIDTAAKKVFFADGRQVDYDVLISTIPLDRLVHIAGLDTLKPQAARLLHSGSHIIGIGLAGRPPESLATKSWMYFPGSDCPFYRVTVFSNYSPNNVPDPRKHWSLMAEISESPGKPVDPATVVADTIQGMRNTRLLDPQQEIVSTWHYHAPYGYPTPTVDRDEVLNALHPELEKLGIHSRGRFGGWKYEVSNQDHSLMQGVELVNRLLLGIPEVTYWFPNTANNIAYAKSR